MSDVICSLNNQQKGCYLNRMVPGKKLQSLIDRNYEDICVMIKDNWDYESTFMLLGEFGLDPS